MVLVHLRNGHTLKLDPALQQDREAIDHPYNQRGVRRVSIIGGAGHRVDLPPIRNRNTRVWIETVHKNGAVRGECVSLRNGGEILKVILYYSDGRIVLDFI